MPAGLASTKQFAESVAEAPFDEEHSQPSSSQNIQTESLDIQDHLCQDEYDVSGSSSTEKNENKKNISHDCFTISSQHCCRKSEEDFQTVNLEDTARNLPKEESYHT